jgi:TPR repeat protein
MKKTLTAICCAALLVPAIYAQIPVPSSPEYATLIAQEGRGNADAAFRLYEAARDGKLYQRKDDNDRAAQRYLSRAAELGSIGARYQFAMSRLSGTGSLRAGQKTAFEYLLELAKLPPSRDFTPEQYFEVHALIGECYENGKGVQPNLELAFRYYLFASVQNEKARLALARNFMKGIDSIRPRIEGNTDAAMYEFFDVFTKNEKRIPEIMGLLRTAGKVDAFSNFLERKAHAGDPVAAYFLASSTFSGKYFPKEVQKSLEIYELAVRYGNLNAAIDLGDIYTFGREFIPVDEEKGVAWYDLALVSSETRETAAKRMLRYVEKQNDPYNLFKFLVFANDLRNARDVIRKNTGMSWSAEDIYLKAKEFKDGKVRLKQYDKRAQSDYFERLHMASNAGYFLAVMDYFLEAGSREYARMIWALELDPHPDAPEWLYTLSVCYRSGGTENKSRDFKKSLEYMIQAAEKGHVTAMDLLVQLYTRGGARYGVPEPVPELAQKYTDMLVQHDYKLKYPSYFNAYLEELERIEGEDYDSTSLNPAFRSVQTSPLAAMALSKIYMEGNTDFEVEKNEWTGIVLLHEAAANGYEPAIRELERIFKEGIPDVLSPNSNFAAKYSSLLKYIPRYIQDEDGTASTSTAATSTTTKPAEETGSTRPQPRFPVIRPTVPRRGMTPGMIPGMGIGPGRTTIPGAGMGRPGTVPGTIPGAGMGRPGTVPGTIPGAGMGRPGTVPGTIPGTVPGAGMGRPGTVPGMGGMPPVPGMGMPGANPAVSPNTNPAVSPNTNPAVSPNTNPVEQKGDDKSQDKADEPETKEDTI